MHQIGIKWANRTTLMHPMQQWPDTNHVAEIAAFAAVAEEGSFTKAASILDRDATVLSRRVQSLERRLGVRLLARTTRHVALTEAGAIFLARAQAIVAALNDAQEEASAHGGGEARGTLRLALPATFGRMWIAPSLPEFMAAHPQVRIDASYANRFVDLVAEGFDVAVRLGELADSRLVARRIAPRRRLLCAAPSFLKRHGAPERPEDLARLPCLAFSGLAAHPNWTFGHTNGERVTVRADGPLVSDDAEGLVYAAVQGFGNVDDRLARWARTRGRDARADPRSMVARGRRRDLCRRSKQPPDACQNACVHRLDRAAFFPHSAVADGIGVPIAMATISVALYWAAAQRRYARTRQGRSATQRASRPTDRQRLARNRRSP